MDFVKKAADSVKGGEENKEQKDQKAQGGEQDHVDKDDVRHGRQEVGPQLRP